jgi:hypothetical protein
MHLLKQESHGEYSLHTFFGDIVPAYAILSHTWGVGSNQEITFKDLRDRTGRHKTGFTKVEFCARQAAKDGLVYFWIDTCCINKDSDSELSEAIRSMFRWYQEASKCYVYLSDVLARSSDPSWEYVFQKSRWFTRDWTLQELLAPRRVDFFSYDNMNERLGSKQELVQHIHQITGIPIEALLGGELSKFSVKKQLSWAENRNTTRGEDKAYCLFGLFDIQIPVLYGETKEKAWRRLINEVQKLPNYDIKESSTCENLVSADENLH